MKFINEKNISKSIIYVFIIIMSLMIFSISYIYVKKTYYEFDEEVKTLTDGLMALLEPLMICFLGGAVGFIVISLFMPLVALIQGLS